MAGYIYGMGQPQHNGRANILPPPYFGYGFYYNPGVQNIEGVTRQFGIFNGVGVGGSGYTPMVSRPTYNYRSYDDNNGQDFEEVDRSSNRSHPPTDLYSRATDPYMAPHTRIPNPRIGIQGLRSSRSHFPANNNNNNNNNHTSSSTTWVQVGPNPYNRNGGIQTIQGDALQRGNFYGRGTGTRTPGHLRISGDVN